MRSLVILAAVAAPLFPVATARACGNAVLLGTDEMTIRVAKAEEYVATGYNARALSVLEAYGGGDQALRRRVTLVEAVAKMRYAHDGSDETPLGHLRRLLARDPESPLLRARVAEALSYFKNARRRAEALAILTELQQRDLMPDAEGWATLARLSALRHDGATRDLALQRCRTTARRVEVCVAPSA